MIDNQNLSMRSMTCFTIYAKYIADLKHGKSLDDANGYGTTACKIISDILGVPWETSVKHIEALIWHHYKNEDSEAKEYIQTNFWTVHRDKSESYIKEQYEKAMSWYALLNYVPEDFFDDTDDTAEREKKRAGMIVLLLGSWILEYAVDAEDLSTAVSKVVLKKIQANALTLKEDGELSTLYADSLKEILQLLAQGNGGTKVVVNGKAQDITETKLFGKWAAFADIMGINAMDLLSETADKKPLLNYQGLTVVKTKNGIKDAYRNICKECAKAEIEAREDQASFGKAIGYGESLHIPTDDTMSFIEALNATMYDEKYLAMLDEKRREENNQLSASNHVVGKGSRQGTASLNQDNVRPFIDSVYHDYDEHRGKSIKNLYFNYKTDKGKQKVKDAIKAYTHDVRFKQVILVFDTTVFGGADDGFLMTDKMICVHNAFESETHSRYYPQIETITLRKGQHSYDIWLNDGKSNEVRIDTNLFSHEEAERLLGLVRLVWKTFKPAKDVHKAQGAEQRENAEKHEESTAIPMANPAINAQQGDGTKQQQVEESGKQMVKCPSCGAQNTSENKFCDECGASMQPPKEQRKCPKCGAPVEVDEKFCTECGAPFETSKCCPNCGAEVKEGKKFCGKCGTKLI